MTIIGTVESLWRYPVKSMGGMEEPEVFVGFAGVYGDRRYAFRSSAARKGFPYLNANVQQEMLLYLPQYRDRERAAKPSNLVEAEIIAPGANPANGDEEDMALDVILPTCEVVAVEDPVLIERLREGLSEDTELRLVRSDRALTDCRPVSLISLQTIAQIESELGMAMDKRRFRANIYFDFGSGGGGGSASGFGAGSGFGSGFGEDDFVGRRMRLGSKATVMVLERDPRCKMISLDPDTGEHNPEVLRRVAQEHDACAGVYCAVLVEGLVKKGDPIELLE
ncbi:MAG TPA: MOSC domain-containing protein [Pyrinomonadaceae bacterium]|nr:MOSC domain-containing protein [Pyrinomonadaceae bacterium]